MAMENPPALSDFKPPLGHFEFEMNPTLNVKK